MKKPLIQCPSRYKRILLPLVLLVTVAGGVVVVLDVVLVFVVVVVVAVHNDGRTPDVTEKATGSNLAEDNCPTSCQEVLSGFSLQMLVKTFCCPWLYPPMRRTS